MKKQVMAVILAAATAIGSAQAAFAENEKVEISFKVGDSILNINGTLTEVETPYVAGEGTTLVPLRVITEAFGAQVDWENTTQTITLTYPDVNIVLQIDNIVAKVNNHSETLSEAPALSENGVTMVPLRFISETFGALVGYDNNTQAITVTKEFDEGLSTVTGVTDMPRTGDSYYKWSIDTPKQMKMTDRKQDGLSTVFTADDNSKFNVAIFRITDDTISFDEAFSKAKDMFSSYTLVNAEKLKDESGNQYFHIQAKNKETFIDYRGFYTDKYIYDVSSEINISDDEAIKNMIISIADSFKIGSIDNSAYDLSSVQNIGGREFRTVTDEDYKVKFLIPADYRKTSDDNTENEFVFRSPDKNSNAYVSLGIYSKTANITAQSLAEKDRGQKTEIFNPDFLEISDVISENGTYKYIYSVTGSKTEDMYSIDIFFEKGDYVYNFAIALDSKEETELLTAIQNSLETEQLDASKIGNIMRNDSEETETKAKFGDYQFAIPNTWKTVISSTSSTMVMHNSTGSAIAATVVEDSSIKKNQTSAIISDYKKKIQNAKENEIIGNTKKETINNREYSTFVYKKATKDGVSYCTEYVTVDSGRIIFFSMLQTDASYNSKELETLKRAINTFEEQ